MTSDFASGTQTEKFLGILGAWSVYPLRVHSKIFKLVIHKDFVLSCRASAASFVSSRNLQEFPSHWYCLVLFLKLYPHIGRGESMSTVSVDVDRRVFTLYIYGTRNSHCIINHHACMTTPIYSIFQRSDMWRNPDAKCLTHRAPDITRRARQFSKSCKLVSIITMFRKYFQSLTG